MRLRTIAWGASLWVLTVAGGSALTWSVISAAGAQLGPLPVPTASSDETDSAPGTAVWSGAAGRITAHCADTGIALVTAVPAVGFSIEVKDRGPDRLRVEFEAKRESAESTVSATCVGGKPEFSVD